MVKSTRTVSTATAKGRTRRTKVEPKLADKTVSRASAVPQFVPRSALCPILGISDKWADTLLKQGVLVREEKGRFDLAKNVQAYVAYKVSLSDKQAPAVENSADRLRLAKEAEIARKMAREDREIILMSEAMEIYDELTGAYLSSLSGMPARITRNLDERKRLETIFDAERSRLARGFSQKRDRLRTGIDPSEAAAETDA